MKALETYPSRDHPANETSDEYAHARNTTKGRTCGTLSKSEWEASCK